jgi:hypothetical protein
MKPLPEHSDEARNDFINKLGELKTQPPPIISTISFAAWRKKSSVEDDSKGAMFDNTALIIEVINHRKPDILLCAGYSIPPAGLKYIEAATKDNQTGILLEVIDENGGNGGNYLVVGGKSTSMGEIYFATAVEAKDKENIKKLENIIGSRKITLHGKSALLLVCGEVNIVRNTTKFQKNVGYDSPIKKAISDNIIIFNPTHTRMSSVRMSPKRTFLSENKRIYISSSNFIRKSYGKIKVRRHDPEKGGTHTLWHNGKECEHLNQAYVPEHVLYREWGVPF